MEKEKVPNLEAMEEEGKEESKEFNHDEHMAKVQEGLQQIIASEDINEIKAIAQSLLEEEKEEKKADIDNMSMEDYGRK